jgi:hypothetical protein
MFRLKAAAEGKSPGPLLSKSGLGYQTFAPVPSK